VYRICLFCHASLGRNEAIEELQVGRCLAFDSAKGRLWVVCPRCSRWNLTPLEERWEAIERCEREFRGTVIRRSTENIGLARLAEGTELIRIGRPLLPEFASWRYQDRLVRRYRTHQRLLYAGIAGNAGYQVLSLAQVVTTSAVMLPATVALGALLAGVWGARFVFGRKVQGGRRTRVTLPDRDEPILVRSADVGVMRVLPHEQAGWKLRLPHTRGVEELTGPTAVYAAGLVLPRITWTRASADVVQQAVARIAAAGGPEPLFASIARENQGRYGTIRTADAMVAAEIGANLSAESEHLDEHLRLLEAHWREAEEIASIADELLVPAHVHARLNEFRRTGDNA
jgi:hypothetical protein